MSTRYAPYDLVPDLTNLGLEQRDVATSLGRVRCYISGDGSAITSVFLHGVGMASTAWSPFIAASQHAGQPGAWLFIDIPGFGGSDLLDTQVTLDDVARAIGEVLDALAVSSVPHLVGHSMGGFLALHLAATAGNLFASVASISGAYSSIVDIVNHPIHGSLRSPFTAATYLALVAGARLRGLGALTLRVGGHTGLLRLGLTGVAAHPTRLPGSFLEALVNGNRPQSFLYAQATGFGYDYRDTWGSIQLPTLGVFGEQDRFVTRRDADILSDASPEAHVVFIEDAGHFAPVEQPEVVLDVLSTWWAQL